ncbi:hypothetical protein ACMFMG_004021 [Clarireedia jacksonii]
MSHLSPAAIFSPSVARQQRAAAKDWSYIDTWLSQKFTNQAIPVFERNPATLKALLALAALNETADEEQELLSRARQNALAEVQGSLTNSPSTELLHTLEDSLSPDGQASLDTLAQLSTSLNISTPSPEAIGRNLDQALERVSIMQRALTAELDRLSSLLESLQSPDYEAASDVPKQTLDIQRKSKILASKLPEIQDRIATLSSLSDSSTPKLTVQVVKDEEDNFKEWLEKVHDLETQVKGFHGLPHDTDLARLELESLRMELRDLTRERDGLFEGLVERESPKKGRW